MQLKFLDDLMKTRKTNRYTCRTKQTKRDRKIIDQRRKKHGLQVDFVDAYLSKLAGCHIKTRCMLEVAHLASGILNIKVDRLAKRNRTAMLCWFAENWTVLQPYLKSSYFTSDIKSDNSSSSTESNIELLTPEVSSPEEVIIRQSERSGFAIDPSDLTQLLNYH